MKSNYQRCSQKPFTQFYSPGQIHSDFVRALYMLINVGQTAQKIIVNRPKIPSGKYFENAPKFKSSPQNNGISAALLKQKLCGSGM
jgi:hypothetical protein